MQQISGLLINYLTNFLDLFSERCEHEEAYLGPITAQEIHENAHFVPLVSSEEHKIEGRTERVDPQCYDHYIVTMPHITDGGSPWERYFIS